MFIPPFVKLIRLVGLLPDMAERYPHEFSGGRCQRFGIAHVLALDSSLLLCLETLSVEVSQVFAGADQSAA